MRKLEKRGRMIMLRIKNVCPYMVALIMPVLLGLIGTTMTVSAQMTPTPSPIPGELAHYSFEEGSGVSAGDSSGNGNDGIVYGATWTTGKIGNALSFDNIDDYVSIPTQNSDEISFCAWFYKNENDTVNADTLFDGLRNHSDLQLKEGFNFVFFNSSPNVLRFMVETQNAAGVKMQRAAQYNFVNSVGSWHHVVGTYNKTTGDQKLFVNGQLVHTVSHQAGNTIVPLTYFPDTKIGQSASLTRNAYFNGIIDEVCIFNRPLTGDEVMVIYSGSHVTPTPSPTPEPSPTPDPSPTPSPEPTPSPTPDPTPSPTPSPISGELAHYSFEEGSGVSVGDSSGNGNDGIVYGATWAAGKIGNALSFDNIDDYVSIPTQNSDEISFCAWFYKYGIDTLNPAGLFGDG
ncbi:MAG: hypothetical protein DCC43_01590 [Candidatus Brocadia sp.]|nr:MAG: hypothetical protein DCC43_01590 [Candidatus Brocadia sp.]